MPHGFHHVVYGTDEEPLGTGMILSAHGELSESQSNFNLAENLLCYPLAFPVDNLLLRLLYPGPHLSPYQLFPFDQQGTALLTNLQALSS